MAWGGIDLIPVRDGETPQQAVDRVYEGGVTMRFGIGDDGAPWGEWIEHPGGKEDPEFISRAERKWMLRALELLEEVQPGWYPDLVEKGEHRRWPHHLRVVHDDSRAVVHIYDQYVSLCGFERWPSGIETDIGPIADHFALSAECVIFEPDTSDIVDVPFNLAI